MREKTIRKKSCGILLLFVVLFLCVSCGKVSDESAAQEITATITPLPTPTAGITLMPTQMPDSTPTSTPTPAPTAIPTPVPAWKTAGEKRENASEQYLFYNEELEEIDVILGLGERLLLISSNMPEYAYEYDYEAATDFYVQLSLYNPDTNTIELTREYPWNGYMLYNYGVLENNQFYIFEDETYCYNIYNEQLEKEKALGNAEPRYDNGVLSSDGNAVYYGEIEGNICRITEEGGSEVVYKNEAWEEPYVTGLFLDNRYIEIKYYTTAARESNCHTAYLDLHTMEIVADLEGTYKANVSPDGELCLLQSMNPESKLSVYEAATRNLICEIDSQMLSECYNYALDWENGVCLTCCDYYDAEYLVSWERNVYDLMTGELQKATVEEKTYAGYEMESAMLSGGIHVSCIMDMEGMRYLSLWDYVNATGKDTAAYFPRYGELSEEIRQYRAELEQKYGILIYMGTEISASEFAYECQVITREEVLWEALEVIDEVLQLYPDGFLEQLKSGGIKNLAFYLAGNLEGKYENNLDYAAALACDNGYERCIVMDVYEWNLYNNLIHEISHWIDSYIEGKEILLGESSYESDFALLNPEDFEYTYSYVSGEAMQEYIYIFDEPERVEQCYFIDAYAQTYPTEDRARCFEYLMSEEGEIYRNCPHIYKKMSYLAESIRKYFDTTGWPEKTAWELALEQED